MPSTVHHGSFRKTTTYKEIRQQERTYTVTLIKWIPFKIFFFFLVKMSHGMLPGIADVMMCFLKLHSHLRNVHNKILQAGSNYNKVN